MASASTKDHHRWLAPMVEGETELSAYEIERRQRVLENAQFLGSLGLKSMPTVPRSNNVKVVLFDFMNRYGEICPNSSYRSKDRP